MVVKRWWIALSLAVIGLMLLAACGESGSGASRLPALAPTITALPPSTPTDIPAPDPLALPAVDWNDTAKFRAAMRPAFAGDIDRFVDRNRYYIVASLDFENGLTVIRGAERVRYTNHSADTLEQIVFRLYPNMAAFGGRMIVYQVAVNDAPVQPGYADNNSVMILTLDQPLKPGQAVEMAIQFSVTAERGMNASYGQFGLQKNVFSGPEWYPMLSVYDEGAGWWTERPTTLGDAVYSESGLYETLLTVPQNFTVAMSGSQIDGMDNGDGTKTLHYVSGPMRDSLLVAGPEFGRLTDQVDGIAVNVYYWPGGENVAEKVLKMSTDSIRIYDENFGPYPYAEFDLAETFNFTGIEYPGMVVIADRSWVLGNDFLEVTVAHEIAHQWWYSLVGNNQVDQPWLDESLTSYSEYLYTRHVYGPKKEKEARDNDRDYYNYYRGTGAPDLGLNLPVAAYNDNNYGVIIYVKGPLFFAELEQTLGTEQFLQALQLYFARYHYEVARPADMLNTFEEATGEQLDALLYQWVGEFPGLDPAVVQEMQARQQESGSQ